MGFLVLLVILENLAIPINLQKKIYGFLCRNRNISPNWISWFFFFFSIYLFIWLHQVLAVAHGIFVAACGIFFLSHGI